MHLSFKALNGSRNTPLHLAVVAAAMSISKSPERSSCVVELLEHGADVHAVNKAGMTPLHEVCQMGAQELAELLLDHGADINRLSGAGESCLFLLLNHSPKVSDGPLLCKLCSLSFPLRLHDRKGRLPSTLMHPGFSKQTERLLMFTRQPRRLQDICKRFVYLKHNHKGRQELRGILPPRVYDFVFNYWEDLHVSSEERGMQDFYRNLFHNAPL